MDAPGNSFKKESLNDRADSGIASQTTNCESVESLYVLEKRLYAISKPMRPSPMNPILLGRRCSEMELYKRSWRRRNEDVDIAERRPEKEIIT